MDVDHVFVADPRGVPDGVDELAAAEGDAGLGGPDVAAVRPALATMANRTMAWATNSLVPSRQAPTAWNGRVTLVPFGSRRRGWW